LEITKSFVVFTPAAKGKRQNQKEKILGMEKSFPEGTAKVNY